MRYKRGQYVLDVCGCIYRITAVVKGENGHLRRLWMRHKEDKDSFYMTRKNASRLKVLPDDKVPEGAKW